MKLKCGEKLVRFEVKGSDHLSRNEQKFSFNINQGKVVGHKAVN